MADGLRFADLEIDTLRKTIADAGETQQLTVLSEGMMPEADVLLCQYRSRRINIHIDLAYGAAILAIDPVDAEELRSLERWLLEHSLHSPIHKP